MSIEYHNGYYGIGHNPSNGFWQLGQMDAQRDARAAEDRRRDDDYRRSLTEPRSFLDTQPRIRCPMSGYSFFGPYQVNSRNSGLDNIYQDAAGIVLWMRGDHTVARIGQGEPLSVLLNDGLRRYTKDNVTCYAVLYTNYEADGTNLSGDERYALWRQLLKQYRISGPFYTYNNGVWEVLQVQP
ncbi:MAG: hypothetical protein DCC75_02450 [Proteobacteria bacterium]|nr:MAG: hypothetical protein DCC75_02450 [Pseudomonadota bacterium]